MSFVTLGFVIGMLVTVTGIGGGSLMTPALIFMGMNPLEAIRLDLFYLSVVKGYAAFLHHRRENMHAPTVAALLCGALPASLLGGWALHRAISVLGLARINHLLTGLIALVIIGAAVVHIRNLHHTPQPRAFSPAALAAVGALVGLLVQFTSIGSGVIVLPLLLAILPARQAVGSDVLFGFAAAAVNGLLHLRIGAPSWSVLMLLLAGAIPGAWIGARVSDRIPALTLRATLAALLSLTGTFLLVRAWAVI